MTHSIPALRPVETMTFDHDRLARVCDEYGHRAEAYIAFVLTEIETLVLTAAHQRAEPSGLQRSCGDLAKLCDTIGMLTLGNAARAVIDCLDRADTAAQAACLARLVRLGQADGLGKWTLDRGAMPDTVA